MLARLAKASPRPRIHMTAQVTPPIQGQVTIFTLDKPNGSVTSTTSTDVNGRASATFPVKRRDPSGTYRGQVDVFMDGVRLSDSGVIEIVNK